MIEEPHWAVVTVGTRNYLHFAKALAASVREFHPQARVIACVVDPLPPEQPDEPGGLEVMGFGQLGIPNARRFLFQYTPFELTCALKSYALDHVFCNTELERLLYLDGDIQVYASLDPLLKRLDDNNILLTPHLTRPRTLGEPDRWEIDTLDTGVFNGGFLGLRRSESALNMLAWWKHRMRNLCKLDINFVDQGWLNGLPALFDGVGIERGTFYNAAVWNLDTRHFRESPEGQILVDDEPLVFFHFASVEPEQNRRLSKVSRQPLTDEPTAVQSLFQRYVSRLHECGLQHYQSLGYGYSHLADGSEILPEWRELIRTDHPAFRDVENPFAIPAREFRQVARGLRWKGQFRRVIRGMGISSS